METYQEHRINQMAEIIGSRSPRKLERLLVVGCGSGVEAAVLADRLGAEVVGIDLNDDFDPQARKRARLEAGDAMGPGLPRLLL